MKTGIVVDGPGDFAALKTRLTQGFKILKTDGPRGHTVSVEQIVARSRKQIAILKAYSCTHIVILTDFEMRRELYSDFRAKLCKALNLLDPSVPITCAVPNRMIENWYLADIAYIASQKVYLRPNVQQRNFEGTHGKDELKKLFVSKYSYDEVEHGAQMFALIRWEEARHNSESLDHFLSALANCGHVLA